MLWGAAVAASPVPPVVRPSLGRARPVLERNRLRLEAPRGPWAPPVRWGRSRSGRIICSPVLECVVNVSEGRRRDVVEAVVAACGAALLDVHTDPDHNRSVLTL